MLEPGFENIIVCGDFVFDGLANKVVRGDQEHKLTRKEGHLLRTFLAHQGQTLTRGFLMKAVWKTEFADDTRTLEVHVHRLRRKIGDDMHHPRYIATVRGTGYRFQPQD
jgi:DNA-binding response OmpR family regulator